MKNDRRGAMIMREIISELKSHAPFTALGTASGVLIMLLLSFAHVSHSSAEMLFWVFHPLHVLLSALVTTAIYRTHSQGGVLRTIIIGYVGSIGIATLSDSIIPFAGEWLLRLPYRGVHIGFIEKWWLVNPLALIGIAVGYVWPHTHFPHFGHVFLSTWASLFHMTMAMDSCVAPAIIPVIALFLFVAVWVPCCTSDIVFPLMWVKKKV